MRDCTAVCYAFIVLNGTGSTFLFAASRYLFCHLYQALLFRCIVLTYCTGWLYHQNGKWAGPDVAVRYLTHSIDSGSCICSYSHSMHTHTTPSRTVRSRRLSVAVRSLMH